MQAISLIVGLCNVTCGVVFALVGMLLASCRIPRGAWYGLTVPNASSSDRNWEQVNKYGGQRLVVWALALLLLGIVCVLLEFPPPESWMAPIGLLPIFLCVMIPILETVAFARGLPSAETAEPAPDGLPETAPAP
jgi:hypothetical protein